MRINTSYVSAIVLGGFLLAGCGSAGNDVAAVRTVGRQADVQPEVAQAALPPPQTLGQATPATVSGKHPPGPSQVCPAQAAYWTGTSTTVMVHVAAPAEDYVEVSVEADTTLWQGAMSRGAGHNFSFAVPGPRVKVVRVRANEAGCIVQQRGAP